MTSAPATFAVARAAEIVGEQNISFDPGKLSAYEIGGISPGGVAWPGSADEVAELLRLSAADGLAVIPCGARTKLEMGLPPERYDLAIDMTRLDRVTAYDPGDLTLGVEAGCALAKLQAVLAEHRQFLPLAVPYFRQTTIGGTVCERRRFSSAAIFRYGARFYFGDRVCHRRRRRGEERRPRGEKCYRIRSA